MVLDAIELRRCERLLPHQLLSPTAAATDMAARREGRAALDRIEAMLDHYPAARGASAVGNGAIDPILTECI